MNSVMFQNIFIYTSSTMIFVITFTVTQVYLCFSKAFWSAEGSLKEPDNVMNKQAEKQLDGKDRTFYFSFFSFVILALTQGHRSQQGTTLWMQEVSPKGIKKYYPPKSSATPKDNKKGFRQFPTVSRNVSWRVQPTILSSHILGTPPNTWWANRTVRKPTRQSRRQQLSWKRNNKQLISKSKCTSQFKDLTRAFCLPL